jgi:hypothetical protein
MESEASPVPKRTGKSAIVRAIFKLSAENAKVADWVADEAVWR